MTQHPLQDLHVRTGRDREARGSVAKVVRSDLREALRRCELELGDGRREHATTEVPSAKHRALAGRIADAVGMSRGHVRHFVGNRDRLLLDTAIAVFANEDGNVGSILPPGTHDIEAALDYLFGPAFNAPDRENAVVLGLVELSRTTPAIADILTTAYGATRDNSRRSSRPRNRRRRRMPA